MVDRDRERLEAMYTPEQLEEYYRLKAEAKRAITDACAGLFVALLSGYDEEFRQKFDAGFRDEVATGMATLAFDESLEETDGKGNEAPAAEEEGQV